MFQKTVLVDCRDHILGRLSSYVAKELLNGQQVVLVRCDQSVMTGSEIRNKLKYLAFLRKRMNTNPKKGPIHYRAPSMIVWRTIRGMVPHKTARGNAAMDRLKVFDGVPHPYDKMKRMVIPDALAVLRLRANRKVTVLGRLSRNVGWKHGDTLDILEEKRHTKAAAYNEQRKALEKLRTQAIEQGGDLLEVNADLEKYGF